ncbi:hypothetical protein BHE74_00052880 [Ensete ventricosum]|nr:hypothetical protein BHE74_00052880 [Ensete ventricosum]
MPHSQASSGRRARAQWRWSLRGGMRQRERLEAGGRAREGGAVGVEVMRGGARRDKSGGEIVAAATGRRDDRWREEATTVPELGMVGSLWFRKLCGRHCGHILGVGCDLQYINF